MDRNRENRRGASLGAGNFSSACRRSRGSFREPSGVLEVEDGIHEIHDLSARLRDRSSNGGRKDRSSRRRRLNSNDSFHIDRDEIAEGSTDESMDEDREEEDEPVRAGNLRRTAAATTTTNRVKSPWKASDEMIGVSVPRKTRSACAKRSHESSPPVFGMGGVSVMLSDASIRRQPSSSPVRTGAASVSPPSSNASMRAGRRMKPVTMKTKTPRATEVSISESEVEVAQFLYGLTRLQAHPSAAKTENFQSSSPKHDFKHHSLNEGSISTVPKASSPISTPFSLPSSSPSLLQHSSSTPAIVMAPKRKKPRPVKLEDSGSTTRLSCSSIPIPLGSNNVGNYMSSNGAPATKIELDKDSEATNMEVLSPKSENEAGTGDGGSFKVEPLLQISSPLQAAPEGDIQPEEKVGPPSPAESKPLPSIEREKNQAPIPMKAENLVSDATCQSPVDQITPKESSPSRELAASLVLESKPDEPNIISTVSIAAKGLHADKFKIDLMAFPTNSSIDSDGLAVTTEKNVTQTSDPKPSPVIEEIASNDKEIANQAEKMETEEAKVKPDSSVPDTDKNSQTNEATGDMELEKRSINDRNSGSLPDDNKPDKGSNKQPTQKPKSTRHTERTVPPARVAASSSAPVPVTLPGWPGGLPPFGYLGSNPANLSGVTSFQGALPVEGKTAIPNAPFLMLPPQRSNRCATHFYIARLVYYQQQLARFNPFWAAASSAAFYGAKPYNLNILPNSDALMLDGSILRNSTPLPHSGLGSGSIVTLNGHSSSDKVPNSFDGQRKQSLIPQSAQQGAAFIFPVVQSKTGGSKNVNVTDNAGLLSATAAAAAAGSGGVATASSNFSNLPASTSDPQYLAMLHGSYPFAIPPAYRVHIGQQQQQQQPQQGMEFVRPFFPSQLLQLQPQSLPQTQNPTTSSGSSSSQKRLQAQHCFPAAKPPRESTGNGDDDGADSVAPKKLSNQNLSSNLGLNSSFPQNFAIMAAAMGGKQHQQNDPNIHMSLKGMETTAPAPPGHSVLQSLPELGRHHYQIPAHPLQLADQLQMSAANQVKTTGRVPVRIGDKSQESGRSQAATAGSAAQQLQKQALARTRPAPANSSSTPTGGMAYADRIPVVYSNSGTKLPAGSSALPTMQSPQQWKMSQRMASAGSPGSASVSASPPPKGALPGQSGSVSFQQTGQTTVGSPAGKGAQPMSSPVSSSRKMTTPAPAILPQSSQVPIPAKTQLLQQHRIQTQQLFFPNSEPVLQHSGGTGGLYQKRQIIPPNSTAQAMFSGSMNQRRSDQQGQSAPTLSLASSATFIGGGSKGQAGYNSLGGNSVAVVAASYTQSASNLPVKSAEQKPAAGRFSSS